MIRALGNNLIVHLFIFTNLNYIIFTNSNFINRIIFK